MSTKISNERKLAEMLAKLPGRDREEIAFCLIHVVEGMEMQKQLSRRSYASAG